MRVRSPLRRSALGWGVLPGVIAAAVLMTGAVGGADSEPLRDAPEAPRHDPQWAWTPPQRAVPPTVPAGDVASSDQAVWHRGSTAIDRHLLRAMRRAGLEPRRPADRAALIRRVTLDLTGLPPTADEVDRFVRDPSPDAYERLVDSLLASPRFGEHLARHWLDLARYADTHGLHLDNYRSIWPFRDWVIAAFNANLPFDQFLTEQLAGDLIEGATPAQRIATGFLRLNQTTSEQGSIYDEVLALNTMDRVDTFGTAMLGLTVACAACHDHPYDPITTRDYYALYAFFNSLDGQPLDNNESAPPPIEMVPDQRQRDQLRQLDARRAALQRAMDQPMAAVDTAQHAWEAIVGGEAVEWVEAEPPTVQRQPLRETMLLQAALPTGRPWRSLRVETLANPPESGSSGSLELGSAAVAEPLDLRSAEVELRSEATDGRWLSVRVVYAERGEAPFLVASAPFCDADSAAELRVRISIPTTESASLRQPPARRFRLSVSDQVPRASRESQLQLGGWEWLGPLPVEAPQYGYERELFAADEASGRAGPGAPPTFTWQQAESWEDGLERRLPSHPEQPSVVLLRRTITAPAAQRVDLVLNTRDGLVVTLNGTLVAEHRGARPLRPFADRYALAMQPGENELMVRVVSHTEAGAFLAMLDSPAAPLPPWVLRLIERGPERRTAEESARLRHFYRRVVCKHPDWLVLADQRAGLERMRDQLLETIPRTLVWRDRATPRPTHVLERGHFDQRGEPVERGVPVSLPPLAPDAPADRLALAQWLTAADHPLTARVAVNRFWQQIFGRGPVASADDFGATGAAPQHPELLDDLAVDFQRGGWDVKRLLRRLVLTDAYRRDAAAPPEHWRRDPDNRLLARGPRRRLDAETLRDQALAAAGSLAERIGGPSVHPPQPVGVWERVALPESNTARYEPDGGADAWRRGLYTFYKRMAPPPALAILDAPGRTVCRVARDRTNTPLQSLVLLNDHQFAQAALGLAASILRHESAGDDAVRIDALMRAVLARPADDRERALFAALLADLRQLYAAAPEQAQRLLSESQELPRAALRPHDRSPAELAAWAALAAAVLNLDEALTN